MGVALAEVIDKLVPISDFSQGKSGKIFNDVYENNSEYIVLKNNIPTAIIVSISEYKKMQEKIARFEKIINAMDTYKLLALAQTRSLDKADDFYDFLRSEGLNISEIEDLADSVEIE